MAIVSISEAARLTGKSRATLHRHIATGKLSKVLQDNTSGDLSYGIDTAELLRVYKTLKNHGDTHVSTEKIEQRFTHDDTSELKSKIALLEQENSSLKAQSMLQQDHIESLKQAMRLLEDKRQKTPTAATEEPKKEELKGFFKRLFS